MAYEQRDMGGILFKNTYKKPGDNKPDYKGTCMVNGESLEIAAWIKEGQKGKFMSLKFSEPRAPQSQGMGEYQPPAQQTQQRPAQRPPARPAQQTMGGYQGEDAPEVKDADCPF